MRTEDLLSFHKATCERLRQIMRAKNADYATNGNGEEDALKNFRAAEQISGGAINTTHGIVQRMMDKVMRVVNLASRPDHAPMVANEPLTDAIDDAINYLIILKAYLRESSEEDHEYTSEGSEHPTFYRGSSECRPCREQGVAASGPAGSRRMED